MANPEHVEIIKQGAVAIKRFRWENPTTRLDLNRADLDGIDLKGADLNGTDFRNAFLRGAFLCGANLRDANLYCADLRDTDLRSAILDDAKLNQVSLLLGTNRSIQFSNSILKAELKESDRRMIEQLLRETSSE